MTPSPLKKKGEKKNGIKVTQRTAYADLHDCVRFNELHVRGSPLPFCSRDPSLTRSELFIKVLWKKIVRSQKDLGTTELEYRETPTFRLRDCRAGGKGEVLECSKS
jgi:hypothetical protein